MLINAKKQSIPYIKIKGVKRSVNNQWGSNLQQPSYVQHSFSARKIVENNECRTSNQRAQHEEKTM